METGVGVAVAWPPVTQPQNVSQIPVKTLKEQLLWVEHFATVEDLRLALLAFKDRYNHGWLVQRHGYQSPAAIRARLLQAAA